MVGDPSGKTDMRAMLTKEQIERNVEAIKNKWKDLLISVMIRP